MHNLVKKFYYEVKSGPGGLSPNEKKLRDKHPRQHKTINNAGDNPLHSVREIGRKIKKVLED